VTPRGLKANLVNQYVQVQGIVTRMTMVRPRIQTSVHYCEATKKGSVKHYNDTYNLAQIAEGREGTGNATGESNNAFPVKDQNDNPLSTEYGYCVYKDSQMVTIQEMPENAPAGQLPRSVQVMLENDLVDSLKPGDRVQVAGVFRVNHRGDSGDFRSVLVATGVKSLLADKQRPQLSEQDLKNIRKLAKDKDIFGVLGESIAPSIEGALNVKKAILLQLLGGAEKNLANGTHLRGDINLMMVGDPSTAKSQLLRHIMDIAPLALNTTGRGSSGVGLTAAVSIDKDTGERHLEAGAMVLADRGVVCIDEFDKMNDADRVAIHEVMEQQTVTIAKAGIHTTLNARCSVVAAANPIYSEYARDQSVGKNIGLPDSLLSRFDLIFIMLDEKDPENDRKIAERVITNHRHHNPNHDHMAHFNFNNDDYVIEPDMKENKTEGGGVGASIYEKHVQKVSGDVTRAVVTREFLKRYISYTKSLKDPELNADCTEYAAQLYSAIRQKAAYADQNDIACPVTVRTLETMIRLATAHAKLRLAK
jgi:DNA replication licensing factor MCM3